VGSKGEVAVLAIHALSTRPKGIVQAHCTGLAELSTTGSLHRLRIAVCCEENLMDGVVMSPHAWMLLGYLIFVFLNVVDLLVTKVILENGGTEWNFVARLLYQHLGIKGIAALKVIILLLFGVQYYFEVLDLYVIFYLNFTFVVVLCLMYRDAVQAGLKDQLVPTRWLNRNNSQE
jgi:Domain of unknown function (DUF5658)